MKEDKITLLLAFPQQRQKRKTLHIPVPEPAQKGSDKAKRGSCVYCCALYSSKKSKGDEITGQWDKHIK